MNLIVSTSFVLLILALAKANSYEKYYPDEKHPGKCVVDGQIVNPGQTIKHPTLECAEFTCDNASGLAIIQTCDPISALPSPLASLPSEYLARPPKCSWGDFIDSKAAYPECCDRHIICIF